MNRKNFLKTVSLASLGATVINSTAFSKNIPSSSSVIIKPARLKAGDKIAIISPGSYITEKELKDSIDNLQKLGFETTYSEKVLLQSGYFAGTDKDRAEDLMEKFSDKSIKGIVCARGGYGCARILPLLDYHVIRANPKVLIGYSDITALLYGIYIKAGLIAFHGPVGTSTFNDFSVDNFKKVLMNPEPNTVFENSTGDNDKNIYGVTTIVDGKGRGRLAGGNLSIMVSLIGTSYDVSFSNKIVFIEEVGEEPYRIDRMLTQLIEAGKFKKASGIMLGLFKDCEIKKEDPSFRKSFTLMDVLMDRLSGLNIPVVYGMSFGHVNDKFTIPFGAVAELDSVKQTITLLDSAVS